MLVCDVCKIMLRATPMKMKLEARCGLNEVLLKTWKENKAVGT
jgi:hypothetical protein